MVRFLLDISELTNTIFLFIYPLQNKYRALGATQGHHVLSWVRTTDASGRAIISLEGQSFSFHGAV